MAEYINKQQILEKAKQHQDSPFGIPLIIAEIEKADALEVVHAEWEEHFAFGCWHYDCPFCDDGYATKYKDKTPPNYCGNCGAKLVVAKNATTEEGVS